jgi:hypothetical protein
MNETTALTSSNVASLLMRFARIEITAMFPRTYPFSGTMRSNEGLLSWQVRCPTPRSGRKGVRWASAFPFTDTRRTILAVAEEFQEEDKLALACLALD